MCDYRAELRALIAAYDKHYRWMLADKFESLRKAAERARAALDEQDSPESWHISRALSDEALRLLTELPMEEIERRLRMDGPAVPKGGELAAIEGQLIGQLISGWLPIDTAPRDGTEILASDYDAIEIVGWYKGSSELHIPGEWVNREGAAIYPSWWQPLPEHPPLPEDQP